MRDRGRETQLHQSCLGSANLAQPSPVPPTLTVDPLGHRCPMPGHTSVGGVGSSRALGLWHSCPHCCLAGRMLAAGPCNQEHPQPQDQPEQQEKEMSGESRAQSHPAPSHHGQAIPDTTTGTSASPELPKTREEVGHWSLSSPLEEEPESCCASVRCKAQAPQATTCGPEVPHATGWAVPSRRPHTCKRGEHPGPSPPTAPRAASLLVMAFGEHQRSGVRGWRPLQSQAARLHQPIGTAQDRQGRKGRIRLALAGAAIPGRRYCTTWLRLKTELLPVHRTLRKARPGVSPPCLAPPQAVPQQRDQAPGPCGSSSTPPSPQAPTAQWGTRGW